MKTTIKFKIDYRASFGAFHADDQITIDRSMVTADVNAEIDTMIKVGVVADITNSVDNDLKFGMHTVSLDVDNSRSNQL